MCLMGAFFGELQQFPRRGIDTTNMIGLLPVEWKIQAEPIPMSSTRPLAALPIRSRKGATICRLSSFLLGNCRDARRFILV
jgi:hypothetical protein